VPNKKCENAAKPSFCRLIAMLNERKTAKKCVALLIPAVAVL
jgi:hypothetical protein